VVIAIVSILSAGSLFLLTPAETRNADWRHLGEAYERQRLSAVSARTPMAIELTPETWVAQIWDRREPAPHWRALGDPHEWSGVIESPDAFPQRIVFLPTGRASGLDLRFTKADGTLVTCSASQWDDFVCADP